MNLPKAYIGHIELSNLVQAPGKVYGRNLDEVYLTHGIYIELKTIIFI